MLNSKNVHTPYNPPMVLTLPVPLKKKHNMLYVPLTKLENTYYGTSIVGPVHAQEAQGEVEAQPHSFLTYAVRWTQGIKFKPWQL
jgi:hypothetical protein